MNASKAKKEAPVQKTSAGVARIHMDFPIPDNYF
jgi:hypothetical protein